MSKAEPVVLVVLLALVFTALAVRLTLGKYMPTSMTRLDCRLGYYRLLSLATYARQATTEENAEWIAVNVTDGHFLFSKPGAPAHPMVIRRRVEGAEEDFKVAAEGCAFGDQEAYKQAMTRLPPAVKDIYQEDGRVTVRLKAVLQQ